MKALVLTASQKLQIQDVPKPKPGKDEVLVKIKASAINHNDMLAYVHSYKGGSTGMILGSDGCGTVVEAGSEENGKWLGKEVVINPGLDWGNDETAQAENFDILGGKVPGTFAEFIIVKTQYLFEKPAHLTAVEASVIPLAGVTAYRALFSRGGLKAGEKVLVTGIGGGVARFLVQFAKAAGAVVYVTSGSEDKLKKAIALGAVGGVNYKDRDWVQKINDLTGGIDLIIDSAAGDDFAKLMQVAKRGGRLVLLGRTKGMISQVDPYEIFWKQLSILGTTMGSPKEFEEMFEFIGKKNIKPIIDSSYPMTKAHEAFERIVRGEQFGKVVLEPIFN